MVHTLHPTSYSRSSLHPNPPTPVLHHVLTPEVSLAEKALRTVAVYFFLLIGLRLAGKRELGQINPFDLVVLLVLSNTLQNAIIGNDNSLTGGIFGATVLMGLNYVIVRFLYNHPRIDRLATGNSVILVQDGKLVESHLRHEMITKEELMVAARRQGIDSIKDIACARLEVGGALTFIEVTPTREDLQHEEVMRRLDAIEALIAQKR